MAKSGRMCDILFEDEEMPHGYMTIYADAGMKDTIAKVEGVRHCYKNIDEYTYHAYLDPRYDPQFVTTNIRLAVTGESKPAPEVDAAKLREMINDITSAAYDWGFHKACWYNALKGSILQGACADLADREMGKCADARTALRTALGIEEK